MLNNKRTISYVVACLAIIVSAVWLGVRHLQQERVVLRLSFPEKPELMDHRKTSNAAWQQITVQIFENLFRFSRSGEIEPSVAKTWEVSNDFKEFKFRLRDDIKFHDNSKLTADDVVYSVLAAKANPPEGNSSYVFGLIDTVEKLSKYEIRITLKSSNVDLLNFLATSAIRIVPNGTYEKSGAPAIYWVGSGPYRLDSVTNGVITLRAFSSYRAPISIDTIQLTYFKDPLSEFRAHHLDAFEVSRGQVAEYKRDVSNYAVFSQPMLGSFFAGMNLLHSPLSNRDYRAAIFYAIDRSSMVENYKVSLKMLPDGPVPYGVMGYKPAKEFRNLDLARKYLAKVPRGLKSKELVFLLSAKPHAMAVYAAQRVASDLEEIGISVKVKLLKARDGVDALIDYYSYLRSGGRFDFYLRGMILERPSSDEVFRQLLDPQSEKNLGHYVNRKAMDYLNTPPTDLKPETLKNYYSKVNDMVMKDFPLVPLGNLYQNFVSHRSWPINLNGISPYFVQFREIKAPK